MGIHRNFILFLCLLFVSIGVFANPQKITFQSKIYNPDGTPLEASAVQFKFSLMDPLSTCVIFSETFTNVDLSSSEGSIVLNLGDGTRDYPVAGGMVWQDGFNNLTSSYNCQAGGTYSPVSTESRKVVMQFNDGGPNGWQTLPAMEINTVPYAMFAYSSDRLGGRPVTDFVLASALPGGGTTAASAGASGYLSSTDWTRFNSAMVNSADITAALGYTPSAGGAITSSDVSTALTYLPPSSADVSANYLKLSGGAVTGNLTVAGSVDATKVLFGDGTTNFPSLTFANDSNTGFYNFFGGNSGTMAVTNNGTTTFVFSPTGLASQSAYAAALNYTNGTPAVPAYGFVADPGMGIYRSAAQSMSFSTSSTERIRIDASGDVGIGVTNPAYALQVSGDISISGAFKVNGVDISTGAGTVTSVSGSGPISVATTTTTPVISISKADTATNGYLSSTDWTTFNNKLANFSTLSSTDISTALTYAPASSSDVSSNYLKLAGGTVTGNLRASSDFTVGGNVGIGTASPSYPLDVVGTAKVQNLYAGPLGGDIRAWTNGGTGGTITAFYNSNTPAAGTTLGTFNLGDGNGANLSIKGVATENHLLGSAYGSALSFYTTPNTTTTPVEKLRIDHNGNVGMGGITNPNYALQVSGDISVSGNFKVNGVNINSGTVSSVSGTSPVSVANGTTTPVISISKADTATNGYLSSTDWTTFNNKLSAITSSDISTALTYQPASSSDLSTNYLAKSGGIVTGALIVSNDLTVNSRVLIPDGSEAAPSLAFSTVPGTGWYLGFGARPSLSVGGSKVYEYTGGHVFTGAVSANGFSLSGIPILDLNSPQTGVNLIGRNGSSQSGGDISITPGTPAATSTGSSTRIFGGVGSGVDQNGGNVYIDGGAPTGTGYSGDIILGATRGKVGIGAAPTGQKLYIEANGSGTGFIRMRDTAGAGNDWDIWPGVNGAGKFSILHNTTTRFLIDNTGKVGIGTTAPGYALQVSGDISVSGAFKVNGVDISSGAGTVTSVSATSPISVATGTTTPAISITRATASVDGYLASSDWTTFNNKLSAITSSDISTALTYQPASSSDLSSSYLKLSGGTMTGQLKAQSGDASAPGISFANDPDTGIYQASAGDLRIAVNGSQQMSFTASGIATNSNSINSAIGGAFSLKGSSAGTAAAPTYSFILDTDTGIYAASSDAVGFSTGGTERMRIIASGDVGIGTSSPATKLDVNGEIKIGNSSAACTAGLAGALRYNGTTSAVEYCNGTDWQTAAGGGFNPTFTTQSSVVGTYTCAAFCSTDLTVSLPSAGTYMVILNGQTWYQGGTRQDQGFARFSLSGGTKSTSRPIPGDSGAGQFHGHLNIMEKIVTTGADTVTLEVNANIWGSIVQFNAPMQWIVIPISSGGAGGGSTQWITNGSDIYYSSGNVGIGTSAPSSVLHIASADATINLDRTSGTLRSGIHFLSAGVKTAEIGTAGTANGGVAGSAAGDLFIRGDNQKILFTTDLGSTAAMTISASGDVGIGTTTPAASLDVSGPIKTGAATVGAACASEGAMAYDTALHAPIYCNQSLVWASMTSSTAAGTYSVRGLRGANNAVTPNTQYDFSAEAVTLMDANGNTVVRKNTGTLTNNVSTAGPTANGRDQVGAFAASSWVSFYFIWNGTTLATLSSASAPPTAPTLPAGYTHWAYLGTIRFNASSEIQVSYIRGTKVHVPRPLITQLTTFTWPALGNFSTATFVPANALTWQTQVNIYGSVGTTAYDFGVQIYGDSGGTFLIDNIQVQGLDAAAGYVSISFPGGANMPYISSTVYYSTRNQTGTPGTLTGIYISLMNYSIPNGGE